MDETQQSEKLAEMLAAVGIKRGSSFTGSKAALSQSHEQQLNEMLAAVGIKKQNDKGEM
ncbi:hypothetical protein [Paenibacillus hemerocallicola]|uniref:hypothetical protein n=1 Tax=Paenibacillus hemerocallicola TaxID=1172614 RepID=UPI00159EE3EF|nr:hypothetical protein [Paenibacillus hemerocallicola]